MIGIVSFDVERLVARRTPYKVHLYSAVCCFLRVVKAFAALTSNFKVWLLQIFRFANMFH
ncbi:hypothetical protein DEO72_LG8g2980 [Vigna unguiculata]|uniref:Uncharacterized protein n=1 Tax=Vigna unguiculata TaxID=3917 RepID=A0A4D6MUY2_VIGUN|nr:hypothetical protein DEO72_LG8g2980 [Vigna unguiculata]